MPNVYFALCPRHQNLRPLSLRNLTAELYPQCHLQIPAAFARVPSISLPTRRAGAAEGRSLPLREPKGQGEATRAIPHLLEDDTGLRAGQRQSGTEERGQQLAQVADFLGKRR
jgi:hypothetical protein